jgi:hypothetical protein
MLTASSVFRVQFEGTWDRKFHFTHKVCYLCNMEGHNFYLETEVERDDTTYSCEMLSAHGEELGVKISDKLRT